MILFLNIGINKQAQAQCPLVFEVLFEEPIIGPEGLAEVDVFLNSSVNFDSNIFRIEFDVDNSIFGCYHELSAFSNANDFTFEILPDGKTLRFIRINGDVLLMPEGLTPLFTMFFYQDPGDCFTYSLDMTFSGNFGNGIQCSLTNLSEDQQRSHCLNSQVVSGLVQRPTGVPHCSNSINGGVPSVIVTDDIWLSNIDSFCITNPSITTFANGYYSFTINPQMDQDIYCDTDADMLCGLSKADEDIIAAHILDLNAFTENWEYIAADVNNDGIISGADIIKIRKLLNGTANPDDFASWHYPTSQSYYLLPSPPHLGVPAYQTNIHFDYYSNPGSNFDFVAIKNGDLNASCTDCTSFQNEDPITRSRGEDIVGLKDDNQLVFNVESDFLMTYLYFDGEIKEEDFNIEIDDDYEYIYNADYVNGKTELMIIRLGKAEKDVNQISVHSNKNLKYSHGEVRFYPHEQQNLVFDTFEIELSPNPASESVNFDAKEGANYTIYNSCGQQFHKSIYNCQPISISALPSGVYFINIEYQGFTSTNKFIKL